MELTKIKKLPPPDYQWIVVGATGQTGHRILQYLVNIKNNGIIGTSRLVENNLPAGPLAYSILDEAKSWGKQVRWHALDLEQEPFDLKASLSLLGSKLSRNTSTVLVCAAAFTNVDGCETDPEKCKRVNEVNTIATLKWAAQEFGAKLIFFSTDYVFDGKNGPYLEDAPRSAISVYGRAKVCVEEWIEKNSRNFLILRTTGVYDYLPRSKNFFMQIIELLQNKKPIRVPYDQYSNPTWAADLARATIELVAGSASGIYNVAGLAHFSRKEFVECIAQYFNLDSGFICAVQTAELKQKAKRPLRGGLICNKLKETLGWIPHDPETVFKYFKSFDGP